MLGDDHSLAQVAAAVRDDGVELMVDIHRDRPQTHGVGAEIAKPCEMEAVVNPACTAAAQNECTRGAKCRRNTEGQYPVRSECVAYICAKHFFVILPTKASRSVDGVVSSASAPACLDGGDGDCEGK